ncbi:MAG: AAA family ATPase [Saprospiraceae bacterium]|nr:AAA family ATPase [Candidatus Vicinibacter affinis]
MRQQIALVALATGSRYPVLLEGEGCSGKLSALSLLASLCDQELIIVNAHRDLQVQDLLVTTMPFVNSKGELWVAQIQSPLVAAVTKGAWLLVLNVNYAPQDVFERLNPLLERRSHLQIDDPPQSIPVHPNFRLFMTAKQGVPFVNPISMALRDRSICFGFEALLRNCSVTDCIRLVFSIPGADKIPDKDLSALVTSSKVDSAKDPRVTFRDVQD